MSTRSQYAPTLSPVNIVIDNWDETLDGERPSKIAFYNYAPGSGDRFEFYDESVMFYLISNEYEQPGVEQKYEAERMVYTVIVATLDNEDRYYQIINAIRRIFLNFQGNETFSRFHLDNISYEQHVFYTWGQGTLVGYLNIVRRR